MAETSERRSANFYPALIVQSSSGVRGDALVALYADPTTHRLLVDAALTVDTLDVPASDETSTIFNGGTALTPLFAPISASTSGDNTIVAAVTSKRIRVINGLIIGSAAVNIYFRDAAAGTAVTGTFNLATNGGFQIPYSPVGNFQTTAGNALVLNLSGNIAVGGWLTYITV